MNSRGDILEQSLATLQSPYSCIKCGEGAMIPAIQEGEPDYTDNYLCAQCHFHDNIPTVGILLSQVFTSIAGIALCFFLLQEYLITDELSRQGSMLNSFALCAALCLLFLGFGYVLYKACQGFKKRRRYLSTKTK